MLSRLAAAILAIALIAAGCGSNLQPTTGPTTEPTAEPRQTSEPSQTPAPGQTNGPGTDPTIGPGPDPVPTDGPEPSPAPLQAPDLESVEDIAQAMFQPELAEQSVVSMLDVLGIGIYNADGTPIRAGTEAGDADLYLFEPEVRALIRMLDQQDQFETWISFRDFHAALAGLGLEASAEQLAQAYADAYAQNPDAPITQFVNALTYPDVEAQMTRLSAWLLFLDGFVPPHAAAEAGAAPFAAVGGFFAASPAPGSGGGWGAAQNNVQSLPGAGLPASADPLIIAHLMTVVTQASVSVSARPATVHEGHGGEGSPAEVTAMVVAAATAFVSPFSGQAVVPITGGLVSGIPVTWNTDAVLARHGSSSQTAAAATDSLGQVKFTYTPKREEADGHGILVTEASLVQAVVSGSDLITRLYGRPDLGALVPAQVLGNGLLTIEWHDEAMEISLTNHYDVTIEAIIGDTHAVGDDSFNGTLAKQDDGTWRGTVSGTASGTQTSQAFGEHCSTTWFATQQVEVIGEEAPNALSGDFVFRFYPITDPVGSMGSGRCPPTRHKLNGVSYAPYNDYGISQPDAGQGVFVILPQKPGGVADYPVRSLPAGSGIIIKDTSWRVDIQFPVP